MSPSRHHLLALCNPLRDIVHLTMKVSAEVWWCSRQWAFRISLLFSKARCKMISLQTKWLAQGHHSSPTAMVSEAHIWSLSVGRLPLTRGYRSHVYWSSCIFKCTVTISVYQDRVPWRLSCVFLSVWIPGGHLGGGQNLVLLLCKRWKKC